RGVEERRLAVLTLAGGVGWLLLLGPASEYPTFAFLAPFLAWGLVEKDTARRGRCLIVTAGVCGLGLGWNSLTRPPWAAAPWLVLALPLGTATFLCWIVRRGMASTEYRVRSTPCSVLSTPYRLLRPESPLKEQISSLT